MSVVGKLLDSYYQALNGNVPGFEIYKVTIPEKAPDNYVWIRPEGGGDAGTKSTFADSIVIVVDIITSFENDANQIACEDADEKIKAIITPNPTNHGLPEQTGIQISLVTRENYTYLIEQAGVKTIYRKASRYRQRILKT